MPTPTSDLFQKIITQKFNQDAYIKSFFPDLPTFLKNNFCTNGKDFVERLERYGSTEKKDEKLTVTPWLKEFAQGVGDLRIYHVITTGNAQCGKSLINTLFMVDFLVFVGLNALWYYPTKQQVDNLVPEMFGKVVRHYIKNVESHFELMGYNAKLSTKEDRQNNSNFQLTSRNASAYFRYASTSAKDHTDSKRGLAVVSGSQASIATDAIWIDERSQIPPSAVGTLLRRQDAARLPGGCIREVGTPGSGLGIETVVENSNYHFYPHIVCSNCYELVQLSPKGCLLHEVNGRYLSNTGRPISWFHRDAAYPHETAYFACPYCKHEITDEQRMNAHFRCLRTGVKYKDFNDKLPTTLEDSLKQRLMVTFHLSPLLRQTLYSLAEKIVRVGCGFEPINPRDFQQQMLGFPSENEQIAITKAMLKTAIARPVPKEPRVCRIAGIDQGRGEDWLYICDYWVEGVDVKTNGFKIYRESELVSPIMRMESARRHVVFASAISRADIPKLLAEYEVDYGFIDNEPDIGQAYDICKHTCLDMADQKTDILDVVKEIHVMGGSLELPAFGINPTYFKDCLLNAFNLHVSIFEFDVDDRNYTAIAKHLCSNEKEPDTNKWIRPQDHVDDLFFAGMFCEAAFHRYVELLVNDTLNSISWYANLKRSR